MSFPLRKGLKLLNLDFVVANTVQWDISFASAGQAVQLKNHVLVIDYEFHYKTSL